MTSRILQMSYVKYSPVYQLYRLLFRDKTLTSPERVAKCSCQNTGVQTSEQKIVTLFCNLFDIDGSYCIWGARRCATCQVAEYRTA